MASAKVDNLVAVREVCSALGIGTFGIRRRMRSGFGREATALYLLGLMRNDLDASFFLLPHHRERYEAAGTVAERRSWIVKRIRRLDRMDDVFCATVDDTHSFSLEDNLLTRNCHHNYIARERHHHREVWVTRKGAVRAGKGELGIIPGSMGAKSFIVRGKGNPESFESCSHGAGRRMSRGEAKRRITLADHVAATEGIECRKDAGVIDESPAAYKDVDAVMRAQADLVEIVHTLRQVVVVKG